MMSKEDNDILTQTDRGTAMGELFRRFWIPACLASELPAPDCSPVRVKMLGEDLVAFRDTDGKVGVIDAYCAHRGAPLFYGRNEESGLRCLYHGWKYDTSGQCVDLPNIPQGANVKNAMRVVAYPTEERAGLIWVYMGPAARKPPFPEFPYFDVPAENVFVTKYEIDCNWLQAQEGDYDPSHAQFLHSNLAEGGPIIRNGGPPTRPESPLTTLEGMVDTAIGILRASTRGDDGESMNVNASHLVLPCFPNAGIASPGVQSTNIRIPIDDAHEMHYRLRWTRRGFTQKELWEYQYGGYQFPLHELGSWRSQQNIDNDYKFDPVIQRQFNYSGVVPFPMQDLMVIEHQWGPIADRTKEHLVASDRTIIFVRRRLLDMAKALADGQEPEEPFKMKAIRQELPAPVSVLRSEGGVTDEVLNRILTEFNTEPLAEQHTVASDDQEIWDGSVAAEPTMN